MSEPAIGGVSFWLSDSMSAKIEMPVGRAFAHFYGSCDEIDAWADEMKAKVAKVRERKINETLAEPRSLGDR